MKRSAEARWQGSLKTGNGQLTTGTKTLNATPYSFSARFESGAGTNPEELLAAAHAGCFTMALTAQLLGAGLTADSIETQCTITLDVPTLTITASDLVMKAKVPGATPEQFGKQAQAAKEGCPVSKLYNTAITLNWTLE
jgi:osmotically inducible protein OsmC